MIKFYTHQEKNYYRPPMPDEMLLRVLFVEKDGCFRVGTDFCDNSKRPSKWMWKADFNGKYTPIPKMRDTISLIGNDKNREIFKTPSPSHRCEIDMWFKKSIEVSLNGLESYGIYYDDKEFEI